MQNGETPSPWLLLRSGVPLGNREQVGRLSPIHTLRRTMLLRKLLRKLSQLQGALVLLPQQTTLLLLPLERMALMPSNGSVHFLETRSV